VDAKPLLTDIAKALNDVKLEAIMIGNAAAAIQGAPVTTLDIDFMFRETHRNMKKLKSFADELQCIILRPYYPVSSLYRVVNDDRGVQIDFMTAIHGIKSFESLRSDSAQVDFEGYKLQVADLKKIIMSKKALGREKDRAVIGTLEKTLHEKENKPGK
jgi:predicted nucleotidyltransferase